MLTKSPANNLIGGVSQQPVAVRRPDQVTEAINCWPSPVDGMSKRPPSKHLAKVINGSVPAALKCHTIYRDSSEQYEIVIKNNGIVVWDIVNNVARTVIDDTGTGFAYLSSMTSEEQLDVLTVADYTFIVNRNQVTAMSGSKTSASPTGAKDEAFVFVRQGNYSSKYVVKFRIAGVDYSKTCNTWDGNTSIGAMPGAIGTGSINSIKTNDIAADLAAQITALAIANLTVTQSGSVLRLSTSGATTITNITTEDSIGDTVLAIVHREVPRVQGYLPEVCYHGFKVKVVGDAEVDGDNYYVEFVAEDSTNRPFSKGSWRECVAADVKYQLDATTMPHQLTRQFNLGVPEFHFNRVTWANRVVGDETSVPDPSFVGKRFQSVFFYKDRLGLLADETINLSETGRYFTFFRATLLTLRDTAPIDIKSNHSKLALFRSAVPHDEDMLLWTNRSQFVLRGGDILSPRTVQCIPVSEFENISDCMPLSSGRSIFFSFLRGQQSGLRELFQVGNVARFDAMDTTAHCPNYITGTAKQIAVTTLEDTAVLRTDTNRNRLWVYKYLWNGQEKVLNSWVRWEFNSSATIRHAAFIENDLYLLVERTGGLYLEKVSLASGLVDASSTYVTLLDRRFDQSQATGLTYSAASGETTFSAPYALESAGTYEVVNKSTAIRYQTRVSGGNIIVRGNLTGVNFWAGEKYRKRVVLSPPLVRIPAGNGSIAEHIPSQKVMQGFVQYSSSRVFHVDVRVGNGDEYRSTFNGLSPGIASLSYERNLYVLANVIYLVGGEIDVDQFPPGTRFSLQGTASNDTVLTVSSATTTSIATVETLTNEGSSGSPVLDVLLSKNPLVGAVDLLEGEFAYSVQGQAGDVSIEIINDSPYPSNIVAASWQIRYNPKGKRMSG